MKIVEKLARDSVMSHMGPDMVVGTCCLVVEVIGKDGRRRFAYLRPSDQTAESTKRLLQDAAQAEVAL